jgi:hypothetical protein
MLQRARKALPALSSLPRRLTGRHVNVRDEVPQGLARLRFSVEIESEAPEKEIDAMVLSWRTGRTPGNLPQFEEAIEPLARREVERHGRVLTGWSVEEGMLDDRPTSFLNAQCSPVIVDPAP